MSKKTMVFVGVVSGVAVWGITRALERFERVPEVQEKHSAFFRRFKNWRQFERADRLRGGAL